MKINLLYGHGDHLQEYVNINPFALEETDNVRIADVKHLDAIVEDIAGGNQYHTKSLD
jgi:hypothetical protein